MRKKLKEIQRALRLYANKERARVNKSFFKTGVGQYGEGDTFIGVTVPATRFVARVYRALPLSDIRILIASPIHEERLLALLILVDQFTRGDDARKTNIYRFYCTHTKHVNNWDLVDLSAPNIIGEYLLRHPKEKSILLRFARSKNIWERRIAIIATFAFIKAGSADETLHIAEMLLANPHDLIHKAVGWMLREVGKKVSREKEREFLDQFAHRMPRTMLRYALEHFPERERREYMEK